MTETLPKAECSHGYFDLFNTFSSKQKLQQAKIYKSNFSLREIHRKIQRRFSVLYAKNYTTLKKVHHLVLAVVTNMSYATQRNQCIICDKLMLQLKEIHVSILTNPNLEKSILLEQLEKNSTRGLELKSRTFESLFKAI